jgi:hypothetical protein
MEVGKISSWLLIFCCCDLQHHITKSQFFLKNYWYILIYVQHNDKKKYKPILKLNILSALFLNINLYLFYSQTGKVYIFFFRSSYYNDKKNAFCSCNKRMELLYRSKTNNNLHLYPKYLDLNINAWMQKLCP